MEKVTFTFRLKKEKVQEYVDIHKNIWKDMEMTLKKAGRSNYSIWLRDNLVMGYYEVEDMEKSKLYLGASEVVKKWNDLIIDLVETEDQKDRNVYAKEMKRVFNLE